MEQRSATALEGVGRQSTDSVKDFGLTVAVLKVYGLPDTEEPKDVFIKKSRSMIGRGDMADITLSVSVVSKAHAHLHCDEVGGQLFIEDLGSSNGTFFNNSKDGSVDEEHRTQLIARRLYAMNEGQRVDFGSGKVYFILESVAKKANLSSFTFAVSDVEFQSPGNNNNNGKNGQASPLDDETPPAPVARRADLDPIKVNESPSIASFLVSPVANLEASPKSSTKGRETDATLDYGYKSPRAEALPATAMINTGDDDFGATLIAPSDADPMDDDDVAPPPTKHDDGVSHSRPAVTTVEALGATVLIPSDDEDAPPPPITATTNPRSKVTDMDPTVVLPPHSQNDDEGRDRSKEAPKAMTKEKTMPSPRGSFKAASAESPTSPILAAGIKKRGAGRMVVETDDDDDDDKKVSAPVAASDDKVETPGHKRSRDDSAEVDTSSPVRKPHGAKTAGTKRAASTSSEESIGAPPEVTASSSPRAPSAKGKRGTPVAKNAKSHSDDEEVSSPASGRKKAPAASETAKSPSASPSKGRTPAGKVGPKVAKAVSKSSSSSRSASPATKGPQWQYKSDLRKGDDKDEAWSDYSAADAAILEAAYQKFKGTKSRAKKVVEVKMPGGVYSCQLVHMIQFRNDDYDRQRPIRRKE